MIMQRGNQLLPPRPPRVGGLDFIWKFELRWLPALLLLPLPPLFGGLGFLPRGDGLKLPRFW
jgi:hypothetical protein